jgi:hypothetical protein
MDKRRTSNSRLHVWCVYNVLPQHQAHITVCIWFYISRCYIISLKETSKERERICGR